MTALFDTDNIFYVPPGQPFRVYDLIEWRKIELRVQSLQTQLHREAFPLVHERAHTTLESLELLAKPERDAKHEQMESFLHSLRLSEPRPNQVSTQEIEKAFLPMRSMFWTRITQEPAESFFPEDYEEQNAQKAGSSIVLATVGTVAFDAFGQAECNLPSENPRSFEFAAIGDTPIVTYEDLSPDEPLPLLREYCGLQGTSNQGEMVTIDLNSMIPEACMAAIPIHRQGEILYATLYLHLMTGAPEQTPIFPFRNAQQHRIGERLKEAGFHPTRRTKRFSCWERGRDTIQLYRELPGKESEGVPVLPSFCLATQADGSSAWEDRVALLASVFLEG